MPLGFGETSFGLTPFAIPVSESAATPNRKLYYAREFDTVDKDFVSSSDGFYPERPVRERIIILLNTTRGSATAIPSIGSNPRESTKADSRYEMRLRHDVERALAPLVNEKAITIEEIIITRSGSLVGIELKYIDLRSNEPDVISI